MAYIVDNTRLLTIEVTRINVMTHFKRKKKQVDVIQYKLVCIIYVL